VKRQFRLRTPAEFASVREKAERGWPHRLLVVYMAPNDLDHTRVGITVSGRVGKAVVRNRVRRRLREAMRTRLSAIGPGHDLVVVARGASAEASWDQLGQALDAVLARAQATRGRSVTV
jgi:ribonuclease P protein component